MLTIRLLCVGRLKQGPEEALAARYVERAQQVARGLGLALEIKELPESRARRPADRKSEEAYQLRAACGEAQGATLIVFDERGRTIDSAGFAALLAAARDGATPLTLVIGGPDGLDESLRTDARHVVALGAMTWPHQLVRVLVAEQIYRAMTILAGHPYHRV